MWGLFNSVLSYELICDEYTKILVFFVVFWQFRWLISINSKFQCEHNFNQLLGSIPSFWLKITSSNCVEVAQNQALITYGKTKKICVCGNLRQSTQICADSADLSYPTYFESKIFIEWWVTIFCYHNLWNLFCTKWFIILPII